MKFSITAAVVALATTVAALPPAVANGAGNGIGNKGNSQVRFPVPDDVTVKQASEKCGDQAELSCCNKATYAGDTTNVDEGILAGALSNLIGAGSGSEGLGLFDQCSKLPLQVNIIAIALNDLVNQQCKQNIACCQNSPSDASDDLIGLGLPCIALGSII
ncbi:hydrophobin family protein [Aspergillus affinis]|uniref:hydrophobin family protein n=1 Tax=Aspergillus affinis TaxID=1070780 RepID=UPI0022FE7590|nr:fungal hydrophobin [Aspergillus affinis]KAI9045396.1 fungal hydrophobin [Aspergillus affinis]